MTVKPQTKNRLRQEDIQRPPAQLEYQSTSEETTKAHTQPRETVSQEDIQRLPAQSEYQTKLYFAFSTLLKSHLLYLTVSYRYKRLNTC